eukprot:jgi/Ulvmu1/4677/UM002_0408.1
MSRVVRLGPREIASSLAFQKLIFFNSWFSMAWWITTVVILLRKYMRGLAIVDPDEVRTIFMVLFMAFEPIRLLAGYYGNLREEVPLLLVLILLSIIPTLPACIYMLVAQYHMDSYQLAIQLPQLVFLLASIGCGSQALLRVHKFNQRQQATMKSLEGELQTTLWGTKPIVNMATAGPQQIAQSNRTAAGQLDGDREHSSTVPSKQGHS